MKICLFGDLECVHVQRAAPGLAAQGHAVHVCCHHPSKLPGVTVEKFAVPSPSLRNPRRWQNRQDSYLKGFLRKFDVVVVCFLSDWGLTPEIMEHGCLVAFPFGSDIVPPPGEDPPSASLTAARLALLRNASAIGAAGPRFAAMVARFAGLAPERVDLMPIGVDTELFKPQPPARDGVIRSPRVGFFKGFRRVYGAPYLVRAIPSVLGEVPHARFDFIGDGPELLLSKQMAGLYEAEAAVNWHRAQPHRNLPNFLAGWDLTAIPSLCESFGVAALESAAMQVPVVASDVGGLPDTVLHEQTGLLVPPQAPEALADALITLLTDTPRRRLMGLAGRAFVKERYEWDTVLRQWETVFEKARDRATAMV